MFEITNRLQAPYASICYIRCEWSDGMAIRASGVVVGYNDILTALHVVFDADHGGWASKITIIPAADTQPSDKPFGEFTDFGMLDGRAANWDFDGDGLLTQAESAGDLALIGMKTRIGDITGWLPVAQVPNDFFGTMAGYPAAGSGMMVESSFADSASVGVYNIDGSLGAGASGGPLLQTLNGTTSVVGVLSGGSASSFASTYAGLFTPQTWNWLQTALNANDVLLAGNLPNRAGSVPGQVFTGGAGADAFNGTAGWDLFIGNGGNDVIEGSAGVDFATYAGVRSAYTVSVSGGAVSVADSVAGRDGSDLLRNVERVKFADISLAFDTAGAAGQAYRLYQAAFDRAPDMAGLGFQMKTLDDGWALVLVANNFIQSPEFSVSYGALNDGQFVTQLYANVLHRAPDASGFAFHTGNLASGFNSRADVLVGFSESPENQANLIGQIQNGMAYTG
jgi:V8-like Glu-specific endopeptidase